MARGLRGAHLVVIMFDGSADHVLAGPTETAPWVVACICGWREQMTGSNMDAAELAAEHWDGVASQAPDRL